MELEKYVIDNIINKIKRTDSLGKEYVLESDLENFKLTVSERCFVNMVLNKKKIATYETIKEDRSTLVRDFEYGEMETLETNDTDQPVMSELEYEDNNLVFANFSELDEYLEYEFIPENVHMVKVHSKDGQPYPSVQLNKLLKLKLNEEEMKHALEYLKQCNIVVRGESQSLEEFENYDYTRNYHYTMLPNPLSWADQYTLFLYYQKTKDPVIREQLILGNLRLVPYVAFKVSISTGYPQDELETAGYEELIHLIDKYNVLVGAKFSTYAVKSLFGVMLREAENSMNLPSYLYYDVRRAIKVVEEDYGVKFSSNDKEMMDDVINILVSSGVIKSNDVKLGIINTLNLYNKDLSEIEIASEESMEQKIVDDTLKDELQEAMAVLNPREQFVISLRFGLEDGVQSTLEDIGKILGVTKDRVRQIEAKALRKLRHPMRKRRTKEYLLDSENQLASGKVDPNSIDDDMSYRGRIL